MSSGLPIDFVSPLPPVRSGISDYSADLLPNLAPLCDLQVVQLPGQPISTDLQERWRPISASATGRNGRLPLYQMGNNEHHRGVVDLALERPGILTLHDVVLHHLLVEMTLGEAQLEPYLERLETDHGWVGQLAANARQWGELGQAAMFSLPAHRTLLRRQRGVLVHSRWAAERVQEDNPDIAVRQIPMGIPLPPEANREQGKFFRRRLGIDADTPLIGSMGFQTPIKRTDRVIAALDQPGMEEAHLLIAGEVSPVLDYASAASEIGVADRVHTTGFLDFDEFGQAIAACDLCVNLRYPTAGETSASLLRVLAMGRPAIVSDYAHSAELPDDVVVKIPLGENEVQELARRVGVLLADRQRLEEMSQAARAYIAEQHEPAQAASSIVQACRELAELPPPGEGTPSLAPPSTLVWRQVWGELDVQGGEPPWQEGQARDLDIHLTNHSSARWLPTGEGTGGVMIELEWRPDPWSGPMEPRWIELPAAIGPGESRSFQIRVRRPLGAGMLVVEPHLQGVSGMNALGGPRWVKFL